MIPFYLYVLCTYSCAHQAHYVHVRVCIALTPRPSSCPSVAGRLEGGWGDCAVFARVDLPLSAAFAFARFALLVLLGLCVVTGLFGFLVFLLFREMVFYFTNIFFNFLFC